MHDSDHGGDGPEITVQGVLPDRHLQGVQPIHLELAQLVDRLDLSVFEGVLDQAVYGAPIGVAQLVGDGLVRDPVNAISTARLRRSAASARLRCWPVTFGMSTRTVIPSESPAERRIASHNWSSFAASINGVK